jgi:hypothetical protein
LNSNFETEWKWNQHIFEHFRFRFHQNATASGALASVSATRSLPLSSTMVLNVFIIENKSKTQMRRMLSWGEAIRGQTNQPSDRSTI